MALQQTPIEEAERAFEAELEVFRTEVEAGLQFLYAYLGLHATLANDPSALRRVNRTPLLWKTIDGALHGSAFIALGRVFDQTSDHNVDRLLGLAQRDLIIFSKERLGERKKKRATMQIRGYRPSSRTSTSRATKIFAKRDGG
jgi:hypothetical protein